jgi:hypothetical protein
VRSGKRSRVKENSARTVGVHNSIFCDQRNLCRRLRAAAHVTARW